MTENKKQNSQKQEGKQKLQALRDILKQQGVDGFIVPRGDEYLGEYVPACGERLSWLTGFTGSAGYAVVLGNDAVVMSDGRYAEQLPKQVDENLYDLSDHTKESPAKWAADKLSKGDKLAYDPRFHTQREVAGWRKALRAKKIELVAVDENLIDLIWNNQPDAPSDPVELFSDKIAGKSSTEKRKEISKIVKSQGGAALIMPQPESIAWLLNIRGSDVPHTPLALSYAVLHEDGNVDWFIDPAKVPQDVRDHLGHGVRIKHPADLENSLRALAKTAIADNEDILIDFARSPVWFKGILDDAGAMVEDIEDPCVMARARKTKAEQQAIIDVHVRDGVAITKMLKWFEEKAPKGKLDELKVVERLEKFRAGEASYRETSFDTISGWNSNGAIIHYHADKKSNKAIKGDGILLLDSGGQYDDGTTDITRTVAVGQPTEQQKIDFTLVLRGHIGVAKQRFPQGANGAQIDALARGALWDDNANFDHGTGHGVGCYLSVHEEAASISPKGQRDFEEGMLISNEPGFYKEGAYGIRIESLVLVQEDGVRRDESLSAGQKPTKFMRFETVTLAPIDHNLIVPEMMSDEELDWLNDYHERVYQTLVPHLDADTGLWLREATQPLKKNSNAVSLKHDQSKASDPRAQGSDSRGANNKPQP